MKRMLIAALLAVSSLNAHAARFAVQLAEFSDASVAQQWVQRLNDDGIPAYAELRQDRTLLRAGPFETRADASKAIAKIKADGFGSDSRTGIAYGDAATGQPTTKSAASYDHSTAVKLDPTSDWYSYDIDRRACVRIRDETGASNPDEYAERLSAAGRPGTVADYPNPDSAIIYIPELGDNQRVTMLARGTAGCTRLMQIANLYGR